MSRSNVKYKFYATLLDAFTWYQKSEYDSAFPEFIDKLNRVPFTSEAAEKGTAFNELVDQIAHEGQVYFEDDKGNVAYGGFVYKKHIVDDFVAMCRFGQYQVYTEAVLPTPFGDVLLYGYIDEILPGGMIIDIKCTSKYEFPKFLKNWQHIVYPYCYKANGMDMPYFSYEITDYNNRYREDYAYSEQRDLPKLTAHVCELIQFIEQHRGLITDQKLFALDEPAVVAREVEKGLGKAGNSGPLFNVSEYDDNNEFGARI